MLGRTHQMIGFASVYTYVLLFPTEVDFLNYQTLFATLILITIGSLAPDLDDEKNRLYTWIPVGHNVVAEIITKFFGKHRSISHSMIGIFLFWHLSKFLIYKIPVENGFQLDLLWHAFMISFLAHLTADALTREGIPLLWPLRLKVGFPPLQFLRMKTGGFIEKYIVRFLVITFLVAISYWKWDSLLDLVRLL